MTLKKDDIRYYLNKALEDVDNIFRKKEKERYFEGLVLQSGILEELLKYSIIFKNIATHTEMTGESFDNYLHRLELFHAIRIAWMLKLIDNNTLEKLDSYRNKRNRLVHKYWERDRKMSISEAEIIYREGRELTDKILSKLNYYTRKFGP